MQLRSVALLSLVVACAPSSKGASTTEAADFHGTYLATAPGAIDALTLDGSRYLLMPNGCRERACAEVGSYAFDDAHTSIVLTGPRARTLSLSSSSSDIAPKNLMDGADSGPPPSLVGSTPTQLLGSTFVVLTSIDGQAFQSASASDDADHNPVCTNTIPDSAGAWWNACPHGPFSASDYNGNLRYVVCEIDPSLGEDALPAVLAAFRDKLGCNAIRVSIDADLSSFAGAMIRKARQDYALAVYASPSDPSIDADRVLAFANAVHPGFLAPFDQSGLDAAQLVDAAGRVKSGLAYRPRLIGPERRGVADTAGLLSAHPEVAQSFDVIGSHDASGAAALSWDGLGQQSGLPIWASVGPDGDPTSAIAGGVTGLVLHGAFPSSVDANGQLTDRGISIAKAIRANREPVEIPLAIGKGMSPVVVLRIGEKTLTATVDTGSTGLWIAPGVLDTTDATFTDTQAGTGYGGRLIVDGYVARAIVGLEGVASTMPIDIGVTDTLTCKAGQECPNIGSKKFFGTDAVLGIGMSPPGARAPTVGNPLHGLEKTGRFVVALDGLDGSGGRLIVDPKTADLARFGANTVSLPALDGGWDDTMVPFCVNDFCSTGLLDTGEGDGILVARTLADAAAIGADKDAVVAPSTTLTFALNGQPAFSIAAGTTSGIDKFKLQSSGKSNNLAVVVYRHLDVLYDEGAGTISLAPKQ